MKLAIIIGFILLGLGGLLFITQGSSNSSSSTQSQTIQTIQKDVASGGQLIDVRTPAEFAESHIDGAINLSLQDIQVGALPSATKDKPVYVYCHSGNRSGQATVILKKAGYTNIIDLGAMTHVQSLGGVIKA